MNQSPAEKHLLHVEMAKLLEAGFGIRQAIAVILKTRPPENQAALLRNTDAALVDGKSITQAFGSNEGVSDLERSIVGAGERGGRLAQAFRHLGDYYEMLAKARQDALRSMIHPLVLLHIGVFLAVVPGGLMAGKGWGSILVSLVLALAGLYVGLFVAGLLVKMVLKAAPQNASVDRLLNLVPVIGKARKSMAMARFTKVYHTGLLAGLSMSETVSNSLMASHSGMIREAGRGLLITAEAGGALGPEFARSGVFPEAFARSYQTAEEAGGLDDDLERWSRVFAGEAAYGVKAVSVAIPKVLYGIILLFVAWKVVSFYFGYYEMLDHIGE